MITACNNCKIITAPNTGILSMDRCENVQVTAISSLIRVRCVRSKRAFGFNRRIYCLKRR